MQRRPLAVIKLRTGSMIDTGAAILSGAHRNSVLQRARRDLLHAFQRNPDTLFDREGMVSRLKLDRWTFVAGSKMNESLEVQRVRVLRDVVGEPAKLRRLVFDDVRVP